MIKWGARIYGQEAVHREKMEMYGKETIKHSPRIRLNEYMISCFVSIIIELYLGRLGNQCLICCRLRDNAQVSIFGEHKNYLAISILLYIQGLMLIYLPVYTLTPVDSAVCCLRDWADAKSSLSYNDTLGS